MFSLVTGFIKSPAIILTKSSVSCISRVNMIKNDTLINSLEPPSGGSLKLLTHLNAASWSYNWLMYISDPQTDNYDDHFYMDYFNMNGMTNIYTNVEFFYLGYFPDGLVCNQGPKYIGLFRLNHKKRVFNAILLIENPHYTHTDSNLHDFKREVMALTDTAHVFFRYNDLKRPEQIRYYLEWMHL